MSINLMIMAIHSLDLKQTAFLIRKILNYWIDFDEIWFGINQNWWFHSVTLRRIEIRSIWNGMEWNAKFKQSNAFNLNRGVVICHINYDYSGTFQLHFTHTDSYSIFGTLFATLKIIINWNGIHRPTDRE